MTSEERRYSCLGCGAVVRADDLISTTGRGGVRDAHLLPGPVPDYCGPVVESAAAVTDAMRCPTPAAVTIYGESGHPEDFIDACEAHVGVLLGTPQFVAGDNRRWTVEAIDEATPGRYCCYLVEPSALDAIWSEYRDPLNEPEDLARMRAKITTIIQIAASPQAVTRVEVVDDTGRTYVRHDVAVRTAIQDEGRTLKVFVSALPEGWGRPREAAPGEVSESAPNMQSVEAGLQNVKPDVIA